jgi:hypothetical protein
MVHEYYSDKWWDKIKNYITLPQNYKEMERLCKHDYQRGFLEGVIKTRSFEANLCELIIQYIKKVFIENLDNKKTRFNDFKTLTVSEIVCEKCKFQGLYLVGLRWENQDTMDPDISVLFMKKSDMIIEKNRIILDCIIDPKFYPLEVLGEKSLLEIAQFLMRGCI